MPFGHTVTAGRPQMYIFGLTVMLLLPKALGITCFGASFDTPGSNYEYKVHFAQDATTTCDLSNTNVTALYMLGSCCREHDNNFGAQPPPCGHGDFNVMDSSSETCTRVFSTALPKDIRHPRDTSLFDEDTVCSDGLYSVVFVQSDCDALSASSVVLDQRQGGADFCWSGHTLSRGRLAGIIVGSLAAAAVLVALPVAYCLWQWRRQQRNDLGDLEEQCTRPQPTSQPQILKVVDSVFVSKQYALSNPIYASHLQKATDGQPYSIELPPASSDEIEGKPSLPLASLSWTEDARNPPSPQGRAEREDDS